MIRWPTSGDLLALALLFCIGALMAVVAVELVSLPPPPPFPRPMNQTPVALISGQEMGSPIPTPMFAAIAQPTRPLWRVEILMRPCLKPLPQPRCTPVPAPRYSMMER